MNVEDDIYVEGECVMVIKSDEDRVLGDRVICHPLFRSLRQRSLKERDIEVSCLCWGHVLLGL